MKHYRFRAYLEPFTGMDEIYETQRFKDIYYEIVSLARGAGSNLTGPKFVFIYDYEAKNRLNVRAICAICNNDGIITVATPNNASVLRMPEVRA